MQNGQGETSIGSVGSGFQPSFSFRTVSQSGALGWYGCGAWPFTWLQVRASQTWSNHFGVEAKAILGRRGSDRPTRFVFCDGGGAATTRRRERPRYKRAGGRFRLGRRPVRPSQTWSNRFEAWRAGHEAGESRLWTLDLRPGTSAASGGAITYPDRNFGRWVKISNSATGGAW
jgi:hypothetical protein